MANAIQIREKLRDWLEGRTSLQQFEDWFVLATWNAHREGDPDAEHLVDEIELNLSEYSGGASTLEQLRQALQELANAVRPFPLLEVVTMPAQWGFGERLEREHGALTASAFFAYVVQASGTPLAVLHAASGSNSTPSVPLKKGISSANSSVLVAQFEVA